MPRSKIELNHEALQRFRKKAFIDQDQDLAERIGMSDATVSRVLAGKLKPSSDFIAGTLDLFGHVWFSELFKVVKVAR